MSLCATGGEDPFPSKKSASINLKLANSPRRFRLCFVLRLCGLHKLLKPRSRSECLARLARLELSCIQEHLVYQTSLPRDQLIISWPTLLQRNQKKPREIRVSSQFLHRLHLWLPTQLQIQPLGLGLQCPVSKSEATYGSGKTTVESCPQRGQGLGLPGPALRDL